MGELLQHFGHLVAAFTATDVNNHLGVRPFGDAMLSNRLARTKRTRNTCRATFGNEEERIQDALTGDQRNVMPKPPDKWARPPNRPALEHDQIFFLFANFESGDRLGHGVLTI